MILADIPPEALESRLGQPGICLRTGPVVTRVRSRLPSVQQGIALHYAKHVVEPVELFADFDISVEHPRGVRRWLAKQVVFCFDGLQPFTPVPGEQGFPMLEWGLNWCVSAHCHQYLIVHAAVLEKRGRALILPAPSGSGKSTLCAGLVFGGGWRLLSDELALIEIGTGRVVPLPRPLSLKNASIDVIRAFAPSANIGAVVAETIKGSVAHVRPPEDAVRRDNEWPLPAWVVVPQYTAGAAARLAPLSRARAFMGLVDNAFNYNVHGKAGFTALAELIERCDCREFTYCDLGEAVAMFDRLEQGN